MRNWKKMGKTNYKHLEALKNKLVQNGKFSKWENQGRFSK